jgi:hypothetical protein
VPPQRLLTDDPPSPDERYCAWYGDAGDGVLYAGEAPFWSALRARGGDATADLERAGPVRIGRFDLARERWLEPLDVGAGGERSGVWDVMHHDNGRVFYTTYFEAAGWVEPASGRMRRLPELGLGLNELAPGPGESILISRYGYAGSGGAVVVIDADGALLDEYPLSAPAGFLTAPKTVAYDPRRHEIWVTTDLFPEQGGELGHDAIVLDSHGRERRRFSRPELHFVVFGGDGTGYFAELEDGELWLRIRPPDAPERRILLDARFASAVDFAQDVQLADDGRIVVSRWSGRIHVVAPDSSLHTLQLPAFDVDGLYYTAVLAGDRLCATYCADVSVVCVDAPPRAPDPGSAGAAERSPGG